MKQGALIISGIINYSVSIPRHFSKDTPYQYLSIFGMVASIDLAVNATAVSSASCKELPFTTEPDKALEKISPVP